MTLRQRHRLWKKALKRKSQGWNVQVVTAIAYSRKGNILGTAINTPSDVPGMRHRHAEGILMGKFGKAIHKIIILRVGRGGTLLPIEPCPECKKLAFRLGITIEEVEHEKGT